MTGEDFYREKYPKVKELTIFDREIIYLLDLYAKKLTSHNRQRVKCDDSSAKPTHST